MKREHSLSIPHHIKISYTYIEASTAFS